MVTLVFCVAVYLYHFPFAPAPLDNPQSNVGGVPVSLVNAGAVVVVLIRTVNAELQFA